MSEQKEQIKLVLQVLDLKDIDNKVLVVKFSDTTTRDDVEGLQQVFYEVLKDLNKKLRVIFLSNKYSISVCKDCPKTNELLKEAEQELIKGKPK